MVAVVEVVSDRSIAYRQANLERLGPVAGQKIDLVRQFSLTKPGFSRPTLDRWEQWFLEYDPIFNAAYFLMATTQVQGIAPRDDGQGVKLHPYQVKAFTALFLWSLRFKRMNAARFQELLNKHPVDYREYPDLTLFMEAQKK